MTCDYFMYHLYACVSNIRHQVSRANLQSHLSDISQEPLPPPLPHIPPSILRTSLEVIGQNGVCLFPISSPVC